MSSQAVLWGLAIEFWDRWGFRLMLIGAGLGALTLMASVASSVILYRVSDFAQKELERETGRLSVEVALANERALRAELELAKFRAPRVISAEQRTIIVERLRLFADTPFVLATLHEPEPQSLLEQIESILIDSNWKQENWSGGALHLDRAHSKHNVGLASANDVVVQLDDAHIPTWMPAIYNLAVALSGAGIATKIETGKLPDGRVVDAINIIIGKKQ